MGVKHKIAFSRQTLEKERTPLSVTICIEPGFEGMETVHLGIRKMKNCQDNSLTILRQIIF